MASIFSLFQPPPNPSHTSAKPSSCNPPVSMIGHSIVKSTAILKGRKNEQHRYINAVLTPTIHPINGKYFAACEKCSCVTFTFFGQGILVKKSNDAKSICISFFSILYYLYQPIQMTPFDLEMKLLIQSLDKPLPHLYPLLNAYLDLTMAPPLDVPTIDAVIQYILIHF
jgi:hypothetical protein